MTQPPGTSEDTSAGALSWETFSVIPERFCIANRLVPPIHTYGKLDPYMLLSAFFFFFSVLNIG